MQSRNSSLRFIERHQSAQRDVERIPKALEVELTRMAVPSECRTPRGDLPSRALGNRINQLRRGAVTPFRVLYEVLAFRIRRGEPVESATASLSVLRAALRGEESADVLALAEIDETVETASRIARARFLADRNESNALALLATESKEIEVSDRICAAALAFVAVRR